MWSRETFFDIIFAKFGENLSYNENLLLYYRRVISDFKMPKLPQNLAKITPKWGREQHFPTYLENGFKDFREIWWESSF